MKTSNLFEALCAALEPDFIKSETFINPTYKDSAFFNAINEIMLIEKCKKILEFTKSTSANELPPSHKDLIKNICLWNVGEKSTAYSFFQEYYKTKRINFPPIFLIYYAIANIHYGNLILGKTLISSVTKANNEMVTKNILKDISTNLQNTEATIIPLNNNPTAA